MEKMICGTMRRIDGRTENVLRTLSANEVAIARAREIRLGSLNQLLLRAKINPMGHGKVK